MLIHTRLVDKVCKKLKLQFISLAKEKLIQDYDEKLSKKTITHKILFNLTIDNYKKSIISMLIVNLEHHEAILSKFWMNKNEILLNIHHDTIVFSNQLDSFISILSISSNAKHLSWLRQISIFFVYALKILKHSALIIQKKAFLINNINAAFFQTLIDQSKKNHTEVFIMFIKNIDKEIIYNIWCNLDFISIVLIDEMTQNLENIKIKLSLKYQNFLDVFDWTQVNKLFLYHSYDHKIEFASDVTSSQCRAYWMFLYKLQKVKKYLNNFFFKKFLIFNKVSYFSFILFILKANENLRFCVNYQKLNAIFKKNWCLLLLIEKIINKIVSCKHLIQLNIILTFNKLWMHFNSKNYIIFITTLEAYKSRVLFFELINELISFQQYNNKFIHSCDID
jgi:hypothetical protein